jgi:hypothetical protein
VKRDFENFFTRCFHLGDCLWEDKTTGLTHQQVRTFIDKEAALRICAGVANTSKHRTRGRPNAITARIASVGFDGEGIHVTIDWSEGLHGANRERARSSPAVRGCVGWLSQGEWSAISHIGCGPKVIISWSGEQSRQGRSRRVRVAATSSTRSASVYV